MKKIIFIISILLIITAICLGLFIVWYIFREKAFDSTSKVYIKKTEDSYQLIRNGEPFYIQGASGDSHFKELADMGGNTIQLYDTINLQSNLDEALKYNLAVIINIPIPNYSPQYSIDKEESRNLKLRIRNLVENYKNHEALLMWNLGNEVYPRLLKKKGLFSIKFFKEIPKKISYIKTYNELIDIIHSEDKNHPVSTTTWMIKIPKIIGIKVFSPGLDLLSYNIFGNTRTVVKKFDEFNYLFRLFPYFISEFGSDGHWGGESKITPWNSPIEQTSIKKAEQIKTRYGLIQDNNGNCLGSLLFFWGKKYECTYTWSSLFEDDYKSEILLEVQKFWGKIDSHPEFIGLDYMLIDGKGAYDNLVFSPNEIKKSTLNLNNNNDSINVKWEICTDVWFNGWSAVKDKDRNVMLPKSVDCFLSSEKSEATFITPSIEGPYRIFVYVFDNRGYFATANTPFYVLNPK